MTDPPPNLTWFAIFSDHPEAIVEVEEAGDLLARFDMAAHLRHHDHRQIKGMWINRREGDSEDVLRIDGLVPVGISVRVYEARRQRGVKESERKPRR